MITSTEFMLNMFVDLNTERACRTKKNQGCNVNLNINYTFFITTMVFNVIAKNYGYDDDDDDKNSYNWSCNYSCLVVIVTCAT